MPRPDAPTVRVAPRALAFYVREIDRSVDEEEARSQITRDVLDYLPLRSSRSPQRDEHGAEIWRAGKDRVAYHVVVRADAIEVTMIGRPHAGWRPRTTPARAPERRSPRRSPALGVQLQQQRERLGHSLDAVAQLAGISVEELRELEAGDSVGGRVLRAVCEVLGLDARLVRLPRGER